jgi:hypothetical protein
MDWASFRIIGVGTRGLSGIVYHIKSAVAQQQSRAAEVAFGSWPCENGAAFGNSRSDNVVSMQPRLRPPA